MSKPIHGRVHGKTIELDEEPGFADGVEVEIIVRPVRQQRPWGAGIERSAGALADSWTEEDDQILNDIYRETQQESRREIPE